MPRLRHVPLTKTAEIAKAGRSERCDLAVQQIKVKIERWNTCATCSARAPPEKAVL